MICHELLRVVPGITCVVGSGGKTSLLATLARELPGTVALTTSTHILPFEGVPLLCDPSPQELRAALRDERVVCVGAAGKGPKLGAPKRCGFGEMAGLADYVLVEADGSKRLPLKAHEGWEPVMVEGGDNCILVLGASGFGRPASEVAHRLGLFCQRAGISAGGMVRPEDVARVLDAERRLGLLPFDRVLVNQVDGERELELARRLAVALEAPVEVCAGSLREGRLSRLR